MALARHRHRLLPLPLPLLLLLLPLPSSSSGAPPPVYALINSKNIVLNCLTEKLVMQGIIDPKYQWTGPLGQITKESQRFVLTEDGTLEFYNIQGSDAGGYSCKMNYVFNSELLTTEINFMLYVYHIPGKSMHLTCEFTADTCGTNAVASFEKHVLETLEKLTDHLQCEIQQWGSQCHAATDTLGKLTHKLAFQFVVFPSALAAEDLCRSSQCENSTSNIKKAYARIQRFFEVQNAAASRGDPFHYVPGSLTGVRVDHCKPGFGKNIKRINNSTVCPGCCVTCPPGSFSAKYDTVCTLCSAGSFNEQYGQVACENCPNAQSSEREGAKTHRKCHRILPMWIAFVLSSTATSLILVTAWAIVTKCRRKTIAVQHIREAESELQKRLQTFAGIASDSEIQEQRSKLSPIKVKRKDKPQYKADLLEEEDESMGLLSNEDITEPSTPTPLSPSPDQTGASELETSFEDQSSPTLEKESDSAPKQQLPRTQQRLADIMKHSSPS